MSADASATAAPAKGFSWRWIVAGIALYAVFAVAMFPASRLAPRLQKSGIIAAGVSGTIWRGRAAGVQLRGIALGPTEWRVSPWRLFTGALSVSLHSERSDGYIDGTLNLKLGGALTIRDTRGTLPLNALSGLGLPGGGTQGWGGNAVLKIEELTLADGWPTAIRGVVELANLVGPPQQPTQVGGYRVTFPAPNSNAPAGEVHGALQSFDDAPLDVIGTVKLLANRNYIVEAQVATRAGAPAAIVKSLQYLGPADAQGRRPLSIAGRL